MSSIFFTKVWLSTRRDDTIVEYLPWPDTKYILMSGILQTHTHQNTDLDDTCWKRDSRVIF